MVRAAVPVAADVDPVEDRAARLVAVDPAVAVGIRSADAQGHGAGLAGLVPLGCSTKGATGTSPRSATTLLYISGEGMVKSRSPSLPLLMVITVEAVPSIATDW